MRLSFEMSFEELMILLKTHSSASELAFKYDYGYEVENYKAIDASVGTENDFIDLIASAHKHGEI